MAHRFYSVQKAKDLTKLSKVKINEVYSNCLDSYKPMIIGFAQCANLRAATGTMIIHKQNS